MDTPAAQWREKGLRDPHKDKYEGKRSELCLGSKSDDELANAVYMFGNCGSDDHPSIVYRTAAKERIFWLSRRVCEGEVKFRQGYEEGAAHYKGCIETANRVIDGQKEQIDHLNRELDEIKKSMPELMADAARTCLKIAYQYCADIADDEGFDADALYQSVLDATNGIVQRGGNASVTNSTGKGDFAQENKDVALYGKCTLKLTFDGKSVSVDIPKDNPSGENNADELINEVLRFGFARHGFAGMRKLFEERAEALSNNH